MRPIPKTGERSGGDVRRRPSFGANARSALAALLAVPGLIATPSAFAQSESPTILILDGSGSMWGQMEGDRAAKFYAARDHLRELLGVAPAQSRVGLASFGHRRKGDCSDVELLVPPETGASERVIETLDKLNPKGKGPVSEALSVAANALDPAEGGSVILIHDNADNCQRDICAVARDIAKTRPSVAVHVVSLGLSRSDLERMSCVAKLTGGKNFVASNEAEIATAVTEAFHLTALDPANATPAEKPAAPAQPSVPVVSDGPPGLRLTTAFAEGGAMSERPVLWTIRTDGASSDTPPLVERRSPEINEPLPPGKYHVSAAIGLVTREAVFEVEEKGPTAARLALDAGTLEIAAAASQDGTPLMSPVLTVTAAEQDSDRAPSAPLWIGRDAKTELVLPAGTYDVDVTDGLAQASQRVTIAPGGMRRANLVLETGTLELSAAGHEGGPPLDKVTFMLEVDDPEVPSGKREIVRSAAPHPTFTVVAGTYYVTAMLGASGVRERVAVSVGANVTKTLVLGISRLELTARLEGAAAETDLPIAYRVTEAGGEKRVVARSSEREPVFKLAAGRYKVDAQLGTLNVRTSQMIDLVAGRDTKVTLPLAATEVHLASLFDQPPDRESRAVIRDIRGRTVWRSRRGEELATLLSPGRYVVRIENGDTLVERTIDVGTGAVAPAEEAAGAAGGEAPEAGEPAAPNR